MPVKITPIGIGRKDFSDQIELSVLPSPVSWQVICKDFVMFTIEPNSTYTFERTYEPTHYILEAVVTVDANVFIEVALQTKYNEEWLTTLARSGFQKVVLEIPASFPFSDFRVLIRNHSNVTVNGIYYHIGLAGIEKVTPQFWG